MKLTPRSIALSLEYHLFKKDRALLKPLVPVRVQAMLRRRARARYLVWEAKDYNEWMKRHLVERAKRYAAELQPGLLSIATPVWDGTPVEYLRRLADSISLQNHSGACEWLVLDNGCTKPEILRSLSDLAKQYKWVSLYRKETNHGIVGGLRACLEHATGRYLCPVDSDDLLYPDCLQIVQWWIRQSGYAPLLYSDEDKLIGTQPVQPYLKPDFDPVLLLNSAYIAHLGVIDRSVALELGAYSDKSAEGSPDWDCFIRFYLAGHEVVHIPEIIYSWRMHPESTADDAGSKPYIHGSQRAVIERYLNARQLAETHQLEYSPLLPGTADWWIRRQHVDPWKTFQVSLNAGSSFSELKRSVPRGTEMVCLLQKNLRPEFEDFLWEAQSLFERFPDAGMVGGWVAGKNGAVADGPLVLGFGESGCGCPDAGRPGVDPGYFTQLRKQRSVSAVSSRFAVLRMEFLNEAFEAGGFQDVPVEELGPWLGQFALHRRRRIIFSPFLQCSLSSGEFSPSSVPLRVKSIDHRYYPRFFGVTEATAYKLRQ